jgi:hypothetical protein
MRRSKRMIPTRGLGLGLVMGSALIAAIPGARKDPVGVYGVVDRVVFEPDRSAPERVQVWGVFALADGIGLRNGEIDRIEMGRYHPARRGYLYYMVNRRDEAATRADWSALEALAGTGEAVAFGGYFPLAPVAPPERTPAAMAEWARGAMSYNGRVRRAGEAPAAPDTFPLRLPNMAPGLRADASRAPVWEVTRVPEPVSPADGGAVAAGAARLVARNIEDATLRYVFEIAGPGGAKETSAPIVPGAGETVWLPAMRLRAGDSYTWRVWTVTAEGATFPPAEATFRAEG